MKIRNRIYAFILVIAMLSSVLTGCASTGSKSPEALAERVIQALFEVDGEEVMDCILPELSAAYRLSKQLTMQLTGKDPEFELMDDFLESISVTYNIKKEDISSIDCTTYVVSKQQENDTAIVRTFVKLKVNDRFDYDECYITAQKIGGKWYMSDLLTSIPSTYSPTSIKIKEEKLDRMKAELDENRMKYDPTEMRVLNDLMIRDIPITADIMQATWDVIDGYTKGKQPRLKAFVDDDESTGFLWEAFVEEYQDNLGLQGGVAATEIINAAVNIPSDIIQICFGDMESAQIIKMFNSDAKTAQIIIDYLAGYDFEAVASSIEDSVVDVKVESEVVAWYDKLFGIIKDIGLKKWEEIAQDKLNALEKEYENILTQNDLWEEGMWKNIEVKIFDHVAQKTTFTDGDMVEILSNIPVDVNTGSYKKYTLGDVYVINKKTVGEISSYIQNLFQSQNTREYNALSNEISEYLDVEFMFELNSNAAKKNTQRVASKVMQEIKNAEKDVKVQEAEVARLNKAAKIIEWADRIMDFAGAAFAGIDAYNQFYKYGLVLDKFEAELKDILNYSGCENTEEIIEEVLDKLTSVVAKGGVEVVVEAFGKSYATTYLNKGIEKLMEESGKAVFGASIGTFTMVFEIAWSAASFIGNYSQAHLQVWGVEDLYRDFLDAKSEVRMAMAGFYALPTDKNFKRLYYTTEYYALLVRSGSQKVCDLLCADAESAKSKFTYFITGLFDGSDIDFRLQAIEEIKEIPGKDERNLYDFQSGLFPAM